MYLSEQLQTLPAYEELLPKIQEIISKGEYFHFRYKNSLNRTIHFSNNRNILDRDFNRDFDTLLVVDMDSSTYYDIRGYDFEQAKRECFFTKHRLDQASQAVISFLARAQM